VERHVKGEKRHASVMAASQKRGMGVMAASQNMVLSGELPAEAYLVVVRQPNH